MATAEPGEKRWTQFCGSALTEVWQGEGACSAKPISATLDSTTELVVAIQSG